MKKVALIISTYNRPSYLQVCLESLKFADLSKLNTLLIVDDFSSDLETIRLINEFELEGVEVIKYFKQENKSIKDSLLYGYNLMFESRHSIVLNLDSDGIVEYNFLNTILNLKEQYPSLIVTGFCCDTLNRDGSVRHEFIYKEPNSIFRKSVGGINMCVGIEQYLKYMKPALIQTLQFGNNWDALTCINSMADSLPIACVYPSVIQHIGWNSSMGHSEGGEPADTANSFKPLSLLSVTLIGIADDVEGLVKAAKISMTDIHFGAVKILSCNEPQEKIEGVEFIKIEKLGSKEAYSKFMFDNVVDYVETEFFMTFQYDGFPIFYKGWTNEFLKFDYTGAAWSWYNDKFRNGNGGCSIRTKRLHEIIKNDKSIVLRNDEHITNFACDHNIGRIYRIYLENNYGIKFAPDEICDKFSIEAWKKEDVRYKGSFAYHGFGIDFHNAGLPYIPYLLPNANRKIF